MRSFQNQCSHVCRGQAWLPGGQEHAAAGQPCYQPDRLTLAEPFPVQPGREEQQSAGDGRPSLPAGHRHEERLCLGEHSSISVIFFLF